MNQAMVKRRRVLWASAGDNQKILEIVCPEIDPSQYPDMALGEGLARYFEDMDFPSKKAQYMAQMARKCLLSAFDQGIKIKDMNWKTLRMFFSKTAKRKSWQAHCLSEMTRIFGWWATGVHRPVEARQPRFNSSPSNGKELTLKFSTRGVSDLLRMMPVDPGKGRFSRLKLALYRHIQELPNDEFGIIETNGGIGSERERMLITKHLSKFLDSKASAWAIKWSPIDEVFMVARKQDWEKINEEAVNA